MNNNSGALSFEATLGNTNFRAKLREINADTQNFTSQLVQEGNKWEQTFNRLGVGIAAVFTFQKAQSFISDIVRVRGEFQQLGIALTTMLQSKEKADKLMSELITFAASTPFGLKETSGAAKQLLAFGSTAESVTGELRQLGDLASGVSVPLGDLVYLYGTLRTQGRAYAMDIRQFAGRGIPIYSELAKVLGVAKGEVSKLVEAGKVGFAEVQKAIENMTGKGSQFGGLMEAQSRSIPGQIERLKDAWDQFLNKIGTESQSVIEGTIDNLSFLVENYETVGKVLIGLIATYGTYRAAIMAVTALKALEALTLDKAAVALGAETVAKVDNAATTANLTAAIASETATRAAAAEATVAQMRAEFMEVAAKEASALEAAKLAAATVAAAEARLVAERTAAAGVTVAEQQMLAVKRVAAAQNELLAATEANLSAQRVLSSATADVNTKKVLLDNAAKNASTLANTANSAATAANVAATNANTIANTRLTIAQQIRVGVTKQLIAVQQLLNRLMLTNPYVLIATSVVALTATLWALHDGTTAQEIAQRRLNKINEEAKKVKEDLLEKTEALNAVIRSETSTMYQQITAYEQLQKLFPSILESLSLQEYQSIKASDAQRKFNAEIDKLEISKLEQRLADARKAVVDYERTLAAVRDNPSEYKGGIAGDIAKQLENAKAEVALLNAELEQTKRRMEEAAELEKVAAMTEEQKVEYYKQQKKELEAQRNSIELTLLLAKKLGYEFGVWQTTLNSIRLDDLNKQIESLNEKLFGNTKGVKNKAYYEKIQKDAEEAYNAIPKDQLGSAEAKQAKRDYQEATKAVEEYRLTEKKAKKPRKLDIALPAGSLGEIDRQIKLAEEALNKIPADQIARIEAMHETLLRLTEARIEAEKVVDFKTWDETLNYKKEQYEKYQQAMEAGYSESAQRMYAPLISEGENWIDFLNKQREELEAILFSGGDLSNSQFAKLVYLGSELRKAMGDKAPFDLFADNLEMIKSKSANLSDYISVLEEKIKGLLETPPSSRDGLWYESFNKLKEELNGANKEIGLQLTQFLQQVQGAQQKRNAIEKKYADLRKKANADELNVIEKEYKKEMEAFALESNQALQKINDTFYANTRAGLVKYIADLKAAYEELKTNVDAAQKDIDAARQRLNDAELQLQDFDAQNWIQFANAIGQVGDEMSGIEGTLGSIGSLLAGAAGQASNFANNLRIAKNNTSGNGNTGESVGAIASGVGSLVGMFISSRKKKKAERLHREVNALAFQAEMNRLLNEEIRLRTILTENVYFKDYIGRIKDAWNAATDAAVKYQQALYMLAKNGEALKGTKNTIDWGNVAAGAGTGAGTGAVVGSIFGPVGTAVGAVVGLIVGGVVGLISTATKSLFGPILEKYPQLIDANGKLNKSLAETLISTDQVNEKTKVWLQDLINASDALEEAKKQITEVVSELSGNLGNDLKDALVGAFEAGEDAAYAFSQTVSKTLENMLSSLIFSSVFKQVFDKLQKDLEGGILAYGLTGGNVSGIYNAFDEFMKGSEDAQKLFQQILQAARDRGLESGFDLFGNSGDSGSNNSAASGISRGITEETSSLISGQINAIRISQAAGLAVLRQHTVQYDRMIHYQRYLVSIDKRLASLNNTPWRALGYDEDPE